MMTMLNILDAAWIALGVSEQELKSFRSRFVIYLGLMAMTILAGVLLVGIVSNLTSTSA